MTTHLATATYGPLLGHPQIHHTIEISEDFDLSHIPEKYLQNFPLYVKYESVHNFNPMDFADLKLRYPPMIEADFEEFALYREFILIQRTRAYHWTGLPFIHLLLTIEDEKDIVNLSKIIPSINNQQITLDPKTPDLLKACAQVLKPEWRIRMKPLLIQDLTPPKEKEEDAPNTESPTVYRSEGPRRGRTPQV